MTKNIDVMLSRPGIYFIVSTVVCFCEVEAGRAYQLEFRSGTYRRNGELRPGGWFVDQIVAIHGPFARTVHTGLTAVNA